MPVTEAPRTRLLASFRERTAAPARVFYAPGRANLLGAHLDYNGGCVMPVALSKGTYLAVATRDDRRLSLVSEQFPGEPVEIGVEELRPGRTRGWSAYVEGALWAAARAWGPLPGLDLHLHADLPMARGLSSSASVECATVHALARLLQVAPGEDELVRLAHAAENEYVGVRCGILDQSAIVHGRADSVLLLDCLEQTREHLPFDGSRARVAVMDSGVARELASSAFNQRVAECTRALATLQERLPGVTCLRDVTREQFEALADLLPPLLQRRTRHVITECERTARGAEALRHGDLADFGAQMTAAHRSLRQDYEVSTPELDALVEASVAVEGCHGARLTGAGFGGCVVAVVERSAAEEFARRAVSGYREATGRSTEVQWFAPSGGPVELTSG